MMIQALWEILLYILFLYINIYGIATFTKDYKSSSKPINPTT